jgi:hypothetical protein
LLLHQQNQDQQAQIQQLQQQRVESESDDESDDDRHLNESDDSDLDESDLDESDDDESDDESEKDEEDDDPLMLSNTMYTACCEGDMETIINLLDAGKSVNCVSQGLDWTPVMAALMNGQINTAIMLLGSGADLSRLDIHGRFTIHHAAIGGDRDCVEWVLANTTININLTTTAHGETPIMECLKRDNLDASKLLIEKGANLFIKDRNGESAMDHALGPQVLQHAKDLIWDSVKPLLLLSKACSTNVLPVDLSVSIPPSLISVLSISGLVREWISPYVMRKGVIIRDPSIPRPPKEPDDVKIRVEAALAAARSLSKKAAAAARTTKGLASRER